MCTFAGKDHLLSENVNIPVLGFRGGCYTFRPDESNLKAINLPGIVCIFEAVDFGTVKMTTASAKFPGKAIFKRI